MRPMEAVSTLTIPVNDQDHIRGPYDAPVTVLEYGDYECPFCSDAHPIVLALQQDAGPIMRFAYRHFPLTNLHPHAEPAAEAAEAAGAQGRFWEMHDILFEHQDALAPDDLAGYADVLGLDVARFVEDLRTHRFSSRVRRDFLSGVRSGVNGTPTFFMNGLRYDGPRDFDTMLSVIEELAGQSQRAHR